MTLLDVVLEFLFSEAQMNIVGTLATETNLVPIRWCHRSPFLVALVLQESAVCYECFC